MDASATCEFRAEAPGRSRGADRRCRAKPDRRAAVPVFGVSRSRVRSWRHLLRLLCLAIAVGPCAATAAPQGDAPAARVSSSVSRTPQARPRTAKRWTPRAPARPAAAVETVTLVAGQPGSTSLDAAYDLATVLSDDRLRVLVILGQEGERNVTDVVRTRGVDMGIVTTADLRRAEQTEAGKHVVYIAKLYNTELHILAKPDIRHLTDLDGRTVNLGEAGSSTQAVAQPLLSHYGIRVTELNLGQKEALERMRTDSSLAATFFVTGKPASIFAGARSGDGWHFLAMPYEPSLGDIYYPASLRRADYPALIPDEAAVDTVAVTSALVAFDWPERSSRHRRLAAFTDLLFERFDRLRADGRHPKWREVNLAAELSGWKRFDAAEKALARSATADAKAAADPTPRPPSGASAEQETSKASAQEQR